MTIEEGEVVEIDGSPATREELADATSTYGHFSAMQVRGGATRGLDLHLRRLNASSRERFGVGLDGDVVRTLIRHALGDATEASVRVYAFEAPETPRVVVTVRPPGGIASPQRLRSVPYQRPDAHIKHLLTEQGRYREEVQREGYDDALLTSDGGIVLETSMANIGFFDEVGVVWPSTAILHGITMQLLERDLPRHGVASRRDRVHVDDVASLAGAFVSSARGIGVVSSIDNVELPVPPDRMTVLEETYAAVPWEWI